MQNPVLASLPILFSAKLEEDKGLQYCFWETESKKIQFPGLQKSILPLLEVEFIVEMQTCVTASLPKNCVWVSFIS